MSRKSRTKSPRGYQEKGSKLREPGGGTRINLYHCNVCPMKFDLKIKLVSHQRKRHNVASQITKSDSILPEKLDSDEPYIKEDLKPTQVNAERLDLRCGSCGLYCDGVAAFSCHSQDCLLPSKNKVLKCPQAGCDYSTTIPDKTRAFAVQVVCDHLRSKHTLEGGYRCALCHRRFASKMALKYHKVQHTKPNRFYCTLCSHFYEKKKYDKHMRSHTAKSGRVCRFCGKRFNNIEDHEDIHLGKFKYKCNMCKKKFRQKGNLKTHKERRHAS